MAETLLKDDLSTAIDREVLSLREFVGEDILESAIILGYYS